MSPDLRLTLRDSFTLRYVALLVLVMALLFWHDCASVKYGNSTFFKFGVAVIWHHALIRRGDMAKVLDYQASAIQALRQGLHDIDQALASGAQSDHPTAGPLWAK